MQSNQTHHGESSIDYFWRWAVELHGICTQGMHVKHIHHVAMQFSDRRTHHPPKKLTLYFDTADEEVLLAHLIDKRCLL